MARRRFNTSQSSSVHSVVPQDDDDISLEKTGIRGGKKCCLFLVVIVLFLVSILNAVVTAGFITILGIRHRGMASFEFLPGGKLVRWMLETEFSNVYLYNGVLGSRFERSLIFNSVNDSDMIFRAADGTGASVRISEDGTYVQTDEWNVIDPETANTTFSVGRRTILTEQQSRNAYVNSMEANLLRSWDTLYPDLFVDSMDKVVFINGSEKVSINSSGERGTELQSQNKDIIFKTQNGSISLESKKGIYLILTHEVDPADTNRTSSYKLCVCMPSGKLFAVPVLRPGMGCANANEDKNPCE